MKATVLIRQEIEISFIRLELAVRYDEDDIPHDFPLRQGDLWKGTVNIDTGEILEWPKGKEGHIHMKVCDCGTYTLVGPDNKKIATLENEYVPNDIVPGEYGDYVDLKINSSGVITNWPKNPDVGAFFTAEE